MTDLPRGRITIPSDVVRRGFGAETVILNLATGQYHGLNETGSRMLDLLEELGDAPTVARRVADEFAVAPDLVAGDLAELCEQLAARGLIAVEPA
jgi:hypothetical protein